MPLSLGAGGLPALHSQDGPRKAGAPDLTSPASMALMAEVVSCLICSSPWQLSRVSASSLALWESAAGATGSYQTPEAPGTASPPWLSIVPPQQAHGLCIIPLCWERIRGGPGKDRGAKCWISHCILWVRMWAWSRDSSGLAAALTGAQGLVQHGQGPQHLDHLCDTTCSAGLGARGSRQTSGTRSSWIKLPNGGVSLGGGLSFSGISQGEDSTALSASGTSQQLSAAAGTSQCLEQPEVLHCPCKFPQCFGGCIPTSAPSAGSVPWLQHQNSDQDHSCPSAMLSSLFQKTKPRRPEGFI